MPWIPTKLTTQQLEQRRTEAIKLLNDPSIKRTQIQIATIIGVTTSAISQWKKRQNEQHLQATPRTGRPKRLNTQQLEELRVLLEKPPTEYEYTRLGWTTTLVADLIEQKYGVTYHPDHVGKILHQLNLSVQRPKIRGKKRNDEVVEAWIKNFPELKKNL